MALSFSGQERALKKDFEDDEGTPDLECRYNLKQAGLEELPREN
jgi:hypothetical protein